jgi:bifunctional NMN adenylyltransferase/nudix hydrolase
MSKKYKVAVIIGRFEPFHNGHKANIDQALLIADHVQILVGSSFQPRTIKNPFTFDERKEAIQNTIGPPQKVPGSLYPSYSVSALEDFKYSNNRWIQQVQAIISTQYPGIEDSDICILGFDKDDSSWYNHAFPSWKFIPLDGFVKFGSTPIDATKVRELMYEGHLDFIQGAVPASVFKSLQAFTETEHYCTLVDEYRHIKAYKASWAVAPFPPTFVCTDAVVVQGGHVLLIRRGHAPGKGLWALPGGFLNQKETTEDACVRELREETKIKVPEIVLRKSITTRDLFDAPDRSLRGRTLTMAFLIELDGGDGSLPRVKGSDDADKAKWVKLAEIEGMGELMFEDHKHIIQTLVSRARK